MLSNMQISSSNQLWVSKSMDCIHLDERVGYREYGSRGLIGRRCRMLRQVLPSPPHTVCQVVTKTS